MVEYVVPGPAGGATSVNTLASGVAAGSGNTMTVATDKLYTGAFAIKMVLGTTNLSVLDYRADGIGTAVTGAQSFGAPSDTASGFNVWWHPVGGFNSASAGLTTALQWYGGTDTVEGSTYARLAYVNAASGLTSSGTLITQTATPVGAGDRIVFSSVGTATNITVGTTYYVVTKTANTFGVATTQGGTALTLGTATGIAYRQGLRFSNAATSSFLTVCPDMASLEGHWVGVRWQHSLGAAATGGRVWFRVYDLGTDVTGPLFPATGSFITGTDVSTAAVTGSGSSATGGIDLGGTGGTLNKLTRWRKGVGTIQTAGTTTWWGYDNIVTGSLSWVAGPAAASAPNNSAVSLSNSYPAAGETITITVSGVVGATSKTVSLVSPPADHPTTLYALLSGQPAYPGGTTAPTIASATPTTSTTIGPLSAGQTWVRVRSVGAGGTTDSYHPIWTHAASLTDVKPQDALGVGYTNEGGAVSLEAALGDQSSATRAEGPTTPTSADYLWILWEPMPAGTIAPVIDYGRKLDNTDTTSGLTWHHILLGEDRTTTLQPEETWLNPASEAGQQLQKSVTIDTGLQTDLTAASSKRALWSKLWATVT